MIPGDFRRRFGVCWLFFGYALAIHVLDEAGHDFLSVYNPRALAIRHAWNVPIPTFTFQGWIGSLSLALTLWLLLTPLAFRGNRTMRWIAIPIATLAGLANGLAHIVSSIYMGRLMPGVYSAPLLLLAGWALLTASPSKDDAVTR
jgi:hypothetical protein